MLFLPISERAHQIMSTLIGVGTAVISVAIVIHSMHLRSHLLRRLYKEDFMICPRCLYSLHPVAQNEICPECGLRIEGDKLKLKWVRFLGLKDEEQ